MIHNVSFIMGIIKVTGWWHKYLKLWYIIYQQALTWMVTSRILAKGLLWVLVYRLSTSKAKSLTLSTVIRFWSNFSSGKNRSITTRKTQSKVKAVTLQIRTQDLEGIGNNKQWAGSKHRIYSAKLKKSIVPIYVTPLLPPYGILFSLEHYCKVNKVKYLDIKRQACHICFLALSLAILLREFNFVISIGLFSIFFIPFFIWVPSLWLLWELNWEPTMCFFKVNNNTIRFIIYNSCYSI